MMDSFISLFIVLLYIVYLNQTRLSGHRFNQFLISMNLQM
ncbi:hypothetical protein EVA_08336 [gut metagenome]|uniref:Uncharacterized protein n=1 Tax=gut metagenome TaxID=749906 RepID=J9GMT6_9ZZZZ